MFKVINSIPDNDETKTKGAKTNNQAQARL